jgi:hypothetical protein
VDINFLESNDLENRKEAKGIILKWILGKWAMKMGGE